jgi:WD40 repeat protein
VTELQGGQGHVNSVAFSPDGCQIVSAIGKNVQVWDAITDIQIIPDLEGHTRDVHSVAFSQDGSSMISKSPHETVVWDAVSGRQLQTIEESGNSLMESIKISNDGWTVDLLTGQTISKLPPMVSHSSYARHKRSVAVGMKSGQLLVINFPSATFTSPDTRNVVGTARLPDTDNHSDESVHHGHDSEDIGDIYNLPYDEQMRLLENIYQF